LNSGRVRAPTTAATTEAPLNYRSPAPLITRFAGS
jgi:hypothetical protein